MVTNRSVPPDTVLPHITYRDVAQASAWLTAMYGERQYGIRDLGGHHWLFSAHARDLSPTDWGATITSQPQH